MTENKLYEISEKAYKRWPLLGTLIIHRFGNLDTGDQIVLAASASLHRKAAFESTAFMMDYLKTSAPFWKSENLKNKKIWVDSKLDDELAAKNGVNKLSSYKFTVGPNISLHKFPGLNSNSAILPTGVTSAAVPVKKHSVTFFNSSSSMSLSITSKSLAFNKSIIVVLVIPFRKVFGKGVWIFPSDILKKILAPVASAIRPHD